MDSKNPRGNAHRDLSDMSHSRIWFVADTHFGHANIIRFCDRPFSSVEEMDRTLVANWNDRVAPDDTVFILGDLFFRCENPEPILETLKGRKRLILGNHDSSWTGKVDLSRFFERVDSFYQGSIGPCGATLCHYPMPEWPHSSRTYMIHGHIHNNTHDDFWPLLAARDRVLNAGVDVNGFRPVTLDELVENNRRFKEAWKQSQESSARLSFAK